MRRFPELTPELSKEGDWAKPSGGSNGCSESSLLSPAPSLPRGGTAAVPILQMLPRGLGAGLALPPPTRPLLCAPPAGWGPLFRGWAAAPGCPPSSQGGTSRGGRERAATDWSRRWLFASSLLIINISMQLMPRRMNNSRACSGGGGRVRPVLRSGSPRYTSLRVNTLLPVCPGTVSRQAF